MTTRFMSLLVGCAVSASFISSVHAQEIAVEPSQTPVAATAAMRQLSNVRVVAIAMPAQTLEAEALWRFDNGLRQILTIESNDPICPPAAPGMATCLAYGNRSYQVRVTNNTVLRQRDGKPLLNGIAVGDRINAYGRFDGNTMDAQIVRNLSQPFATKTVQIEGLNVTAVEQGKDGIQISAVKGNGPCWNYYGAQERMAFPCPAGTQPAPYVRQGDTAAMPLVAEYYQIAVPRTAMILDRDRAPIAASSIRTGDTINVYGSLVGTSMVQASVVRVTSRTASSDKLKIGVIRGTASLKTGEQVAIALQARGGQAPYTWEAENLPDGVTLQAAGPIYCITTPCPQPDTQQAELTGVATKAGKYRTRITVSDAQGTRSYLDLPITITGENTQNISVAVKTNRSTYRPDEEMRITITAKNTTRKTQTLAFTNSCEADYDVLPGFSLRTVQLCALATSEIQLLPGQKKTYRFTHDLATHPMPKIAAPFDLEVVGRVQNVGEARTSITINPMR